MSDRGTFQSRSGFSGCRDSARLHLGERGYGFQSRSGFSGCRDNL